MRLERLHALLRVLEARLRPRDRHRCDPELAEDRLAEAEQAAAARSDENDVLHHVPGPLHGEGQRSRGERVDVLACQVAVVADRALEQPIDDREGRHCRHVDEQPPGRLEERVDSEQEQVRRNEVLQQV